MELNEYAVSLFQAVEQVENLKFFGDSAELSKTEFRLMREVINEREKGKDVISSELARRLSVTRSAVSQIVTKLEERGIVVRTPAPNDKKIAYIRLSERSEAVYEQQCKQVNDLLNAVAEKFGAARMKRIEKDCTDFLKLLNETYAQTCADSKK